MNWHLSRLCLAVLGCPILQLNVLDDLADAMKALDGKKGLCMSPGVQYHPVKE